MNIMLLGAPGAGKGTQASRIIGFYGLVHISTGDILRKAVADETELGLAAKRYMDSGALVPDEVVIGLMEERIAQPDCLHGFILDGFPRTVAQAEALDGTLMGMGKMLDAVISIDVDHEAIVRRLTARRQCRECGRVYNLITDRSKRYDLCDSCGGEVYQRDDDTEETVRNRLDVYERSTAPLVAYYEGKGLLRKVDGNQEPGAVFNEVREILDGLV